jgi:hypothetical protein
MIFNLLKKTSFDSIASLCETDKDYSTFVKSRLDLYKSPPGYFPWNIHLKAVFTASGSVTAAKNYQSGDYIGAKVGEHSREVLENNAPARFLSRELCEAFMNTPIPALTKDILEVLPYMHIMLPRGIVFDHCGDEIVSLMVKAGELYPKSNEMQDKMNRELCKKYFPDSIITPKHMHGATGVQLVTVTENGCNCWQEYIDESSRSWHSENIKYSEKSGYDKKETEMVMRVGINSLLVHLYEPELITVEKARETRGQGFSGGPGKSPLSVTWIGNGFRYLREKETALPGQEGAKGAVRAHWRRGHWHSYLVNKGRTDRVVKWVKPIYVRGSSDS